jgi:hypothetical protein
MKFHVAITCDNAAFDDPDRNAEIARILRRLADRVEADVLNLPYGMKSFSHTLRDVNGNDVGRATFVVGD